ncbi:hypothetical protein N7671_14380 [Pseudomonas oleovorans]|uniref:Secreted protein n=1 Tax=Ectopseudomonas oleovorans TaxID=301 RepID=A0AB35L4G7_ECTOL|nr:hypothetical protein [Pseudomonas oleovorans]MDH0568394.1 hypothetical protein [Pseudomonas oleovorans]
MAQSVPKLALLLLVISRHITQQIQLLKIKNHNQTSLYWPAFLSAPISAPSAMRSLVLLGSSFQRHGAGCFSILMTKGLRALLLTAHAECR